MPIKLAGSDNWNIKDRNDCLPQL